MEGTEQIHRKQKSIEINQKTEIRISIPQSKEENANFSLLKCAFLQAVLYIYFKNIQIIKTIKFNKVLLNKN